MSTSARQIRNNLYSFPIRCDALEPHPGVTLPLASSTDPPDLQRFTVLEALQKTLLVEQLMELFCSLTQRLVPHTSMIFENPEHQLHLRARPGGLHRCEYQLSIHEEELGHLTFERRERFSESELQRLETLIGLLLYPLRNALLYHKALRAAYKDPLTGIHNRAALECSLERELSLARRNNMPLSMLLLDIDYFKTINDRHGHIAGDNVLRAVVQAINQNIRTSDVLYRYGGEEFVVLLSNTEPSAARCVAERIRRVIEALDHRHGETNIQLTISLGVATLSPGEDGQGLFERADKALYRAKNEGRNRVVEANESGVQPC